MRTLLFFFFNDTATTEIYTLSLHDALPISKLGAAKRARIRSGPPRKGRPTQATAYSGAAVVGPGDRILLLRDRESTRLDSTHGYISYAVFWLKKKKTRKE